MKLCIFVFVLMVVFGLVCFLNDKFWFVLDIKFVLLICYGIQDVQFFYQFGCYYYGQNCLVQVEEVYLQVMVVDENYVDVFNVLGILYVECGEFE